MKKYYLLSIILALFSCVEKYEPEIIGEENMLIVEALITDKAEPYKVTLTRSNKLNDSYKVIYEQNAIVVISEENGNSTTLIETSPGNYQSNPDELRGALGKAYILTIYTDDGKTYESDPVILVDVVDIDSVFITYREEFNYDVNKLEKGIDINVSTKEWSPDEEYFLQWTYTETSKLVPTYSAMGRPDIPPLRPCYNIENSSEIITENTSLIFKNKINKKKIVSYNDDDTKPHFGYSILVRQLALNESVYQFWQMLEENTEENGDLFDEIPFNPISNITCISDEKTKVFGYFNASRVSEKRLSFIPPIYDMHFVNIYDKKCGLLYYDEDDFDDYLNVFGYDSTDVYIYDISGGQVMFFTNRFCVDCAVSSTTLEAPDYWIFD